MTFGEGVNLPLALVHRAQSALNERRCPAVAGHLLIKLHSVEVIQCVPEPSEPNYPGPPWLSELVR